MTKIKKRNELSIFNDFRIKPPTTSIDIKDYPKEKDLHSLQLLCKVDKNNKPTSWWKKNINGKLTQVNQLGEVVFSGDKDFEKKTPLESVEDVELLRALEIGMKIKTLELKGESFSIDVVNDYKKALIKFKFDKILNKYKN